MLYLKATAVGVISSLLFIAIWILVTILVPLLLMARNESGIAAVAGGAELPLLVGAVGFMIGFYWIIRRARRLTLSK